MQTGNKRGGSWRRQAGAGGGHAGTANRFLDDEEQYGNVYEHIVVRRLFPYLKPYKREGFVAITGLLAYTLASVLFPLLIQIAIDRYIIPGDLDGLFFISALFFVIAVLGAIGNRAQIYYMARVGQGLIRTLRNDLFSHLNTLSMGFWDRSQVGRIMSRVTNDVNQIQEVMTQGLVGTIAQLLTLIGIVAVMFAMDWMLASATLVGIPILILIVSVWQRFARDAFVAVRQAIANVNGTLQEDVSGAKAIQSMRRQERNIDEFDEINRSHLDANIRAAFLSGIMMPVVEINSAIAIGVVVVFGGFRALNGDTSAGEVVAFLLYAQRFFEPIRNIIMQYSELQRAMAGGVRVFELMDAESDVVDKEDAYPLPTITGEIKFDQVTFEYVPGQPILKDIDVTIQPGQTVALVGHTGAGKTSFVNLVPRLYDVTQGNITIDGIDVRDVTHISISRQMGVVLQDPFLFSGTVEDNILFGRPDASLDEVKQAARVVGADHFIEMLDDQYQGEVSERGANFSVGQRQLLSFARAVLADPRILILDEATGNIDTHTERLIQEALNELLKGRTSIVIAHRLSTIRNADQIIVLENGEIQEMGDHNTLLAKGGVYTRLYTMNYASLDETKSLGEQSEEIKA